MENSKRFLTPLNIILILFFLGISAYVYYGFFFPDAAVLYSYPFARTLSMIIKIFFPFLIIGTIMIYRLIYLKKVEISSVFLLLFTLFFFLLLAYPVGDYFYRNSLAANIEQFHSFLQLNPPAVEGYDSTQYNIFCLGGSTTEFNDELGRDWPGMLQNELNKISSFKDIRVHNLGKQWYSTQHILINYEINLMQYKPDAIIVMENINDLLQNADFSWLSHGEFREDYGHFLGPITRLVKYQSFALFVKNAIKELWYSDKITEVELSEFSGLKSFEKNLKSIIKEAHENGTKVILMTQPNIYKESMTQTELESLTMLNVEALGGGKKWSFKTALNGINMYNEKIREIASGKDDVYLIDLEKVVPKSLEYFIDDVHFNSKSHDLIAQHVSREITKILND